MKNRSIKVNAIYNVINQGCVILFQLITFPYVSRILHSANYGRVNFCNSILSYFLLLAQLGITNYVIREGTGIREDREKLETLINEVFTINLISTLASIALYIIMVFAWGRLENEKWIMFALGFQLVLNVFNVEWLNNIYEDFKYIAIRNSIIQILSLASILVFVKSENDFVIYAYILAFSASLNYCINFIRYKKKLNIQAKFSVNVYKHIKPILILFFNALAVSIYVNSDTTILGIFKTDSIVGVYSVAVKIYTVVKKIFQAVVIVSVPRLSLYYTKKEYEKYNFLLQKMHDTVITIVLPLLVGLILISRNAVLLVSGEEYVEGVLSLQILCVALIFSSLANYYVSCVLLPNKKESMILVYTVISSLVNVGLNFIFVPILSLDGAAITTVIAEAIVMFLSYYAAGKYRQTLACLKTYAKIITGCFGIVVSCFIVSKLNCDLFADTILKIILSGTMYILIEMILKNPIIIAILIKAKEFCHIK